MLWGGLSEAASLKIFYRSVGHEAASGHAALPYFKTSTLPPSLKPKPLTFFRFPISAFNFSFTFTFTNHPTFPCLNLNLNVNLTAPSQLNNQFLKLCQRHPARIPLTFFRFPISAFNFSFTFTFTNHPTFPCLNLILHIVTGKQIGRAHV